MNEQRKEKLREEIRKNNRIIKGLGIFGTMFVIGSLAFIVYMGKSLKQDWSNTREKSVLMNQLFGPKGYADTNKDGKISFDEQVDVYRRMQFTNDNFGGYWPIPTNDDLKRAINTYQVRNFIDYAPIFERFDSRAADPSGCER